MVKPAPTASAREIQRDGRRAIRFMRIFCRLDLPSEIRVHPHRPTIACGNHQSLLDVFCAAAFTASTGVSCRFLVNARYFSNGLIGRWLIRIGCIPLDRHTKDNAFTEALQSLANRELIGIMPEGRLTPPDERSPQVGQLRPGAAELAREAGAVLRPIAFHNTGIVWPRNRWPRLRLRRPTVTLRLSEEWIEPSDDPEHDMDRIAKILTDMLHELDAERR